jgi:hypothetical protein
VSAPVALAVMRGLEDRFEEIRFVFVEDELRNVFEAVHARSSATPDSYLCLIVTKPVRAQRRSSATQGHPLVTDRHKALRGGA